MACGYQRQLSLLRGHGSKSRRRSQFRWLWAVSDRLERRLQVSDDKGWSLSWSHPAFSLGNYGARPNDAFHYPDLLDGRSRQRHGWSPQRNFKRRAARFRDFELHAGPGTITGEVQTTWDFVSGITPVEPSYPGGGSLTIAGALVAGPTR